MQNSVFNKINVSARIVVLLLLILCILLAQSIYLLAFLALLCIFFVILTNKSVKFYVDLIKNVKFWLLFVFIAYIIINRNIIDSFVFLYKILLIILIVKQFCLTVNFCTLANGIMTLLNFIGIKFREDKISYSIVSFMYSIKVYIMSKKEIFNKYDIEKRLKYQFSLRYNIFPRVFFTMSKMEILESSLKLKLYNPKLEQKNIESRITLIVFFTMFVIVVLKEVIL